MKYVRFTTKNGYYGAIKLNVYYRVVSFQKDKGVMRKGRIELIIDGYKLSQDLFEETDIVIKGFRKEKLERILQK